VDSFAWPTDWPHGTPLPPPTAWGRPGLLLAFNLECPGCVSRAVPWLKRVAARAEASIVVAAVHTAYGHRPLERDAVLPQLLRYAGPFAALPFPVAFDESGAWAEGMGAEGTPHWFAFDAAGALVRSVYGSQENALTRLGYLLEGWGVPEA
jgi:hypothetical protein